MIIALDLSPQEETIISYLAGFDLTGKQLKLAQIQNYWLVVGCATWSAMFDEGQIRVYFVALLYTTRIRNASRGPVVGQEAIFELNRGCLSFFSESCSASFVSLETIRFSFRTKDYL